MKIQTIVSGLLLVWIASCRTGSENQSTSGVPVVSVSILPQKYFIEHIAGDLVKVNVMVPPGASPATYEPSASQLARLAESDIYMRIGYIGFEMSWMKKIRDMNPSMNVTDLSARVDLITTEEQEVTVQGRTKEQEHGHGGDDPVHAEEHGHSHGGVDPHIWMSARNARIIATNIYRELLPLLPENQEELLARYRLLTKDLDSLDTVIEEMLDGLEGGSFMIYHPALTYFARDYRLEQYPLELEGKTPSPAHMRWLTDMARKNNIATIFLQMQFDQDNARALARETGAEIVQINPLDPDWYGQMLYIAQKLAETLQQEDTER